MHWSKPLRLHLGVLVVASLLCTSVPIIWLAFRHGSDAAVGAGAQQMREMSLRLIEGYRNTLQGGTEAVALASTLPQFVSPPSEDIEAKQEFFLEVLRNVPNATSIYTGYPDGSYLQVISTEREDVRQTLAAPDGTAFAIRTIARRQRADVVSTLRFLDRDARPISERNVEYASFDPRQRPWYQSVVQDGLPVSVGPYVAGTLKVPTLTIAAPMRDNDQVVVGINIHLQTVSRLLDAQQISPRARAYILDAGDDLVAHSDPAVMSRIIAIWSRSAGSLQATANNFDKSLDTVARLRRDPAFAEGGLARIDLDGESHLVQIAPVSLSGLFTGSAVAIVVPMEELVAKAHRLLLHNLLIASAFVIAGVAASVMLSRMVSRSLYRLADEARRIGDLEVDEKGVSHSWISEINTLAGALAASRHAISQFALYVPREVVRRIVNPEGRAVAKAQRQDVTVLFTDIRDFTTISEQHSPEDVVDTLSAYFELLNTIAERHGGTVVQYLGDSIFVMWNAPVPDARHAENGCRCALAMKAAIDELNEANRRNGRPALITRFGLHTGPAVVGSFGAISRQQYTAMGDTINVASRLEGLNKEFNTSILVSSAIHDAVADCFVLRPLGLVPVKGRAEKVDLWELVGESRRTQE
ncbi:adenylate/guanylate cyclase domain-containing protein [Rhizobium laguerreae]|uniref:adenylate/guanylate cyclase domain-containing protein n=1 Tax=Rhizobium laguerreae TaxID=1076926 RepID=UPI001C927741|nr:adenylate/guanylate cyclase domain-containing protein [Rhizobium laguerreae]MBY3036331.1 adenylate/guanylate cyclase domain-containing protein [Rhizobium laguerreae]MBY3347247.1 adenylate/guanylate cyclase domain-containing protein [Rhizobium laguerreae]MBY3354208.1 adenylate/guanylate cyclase domain-containing protein [Rhizobium laguerreae]MBY3375254.1 adenylate/guanylate cyclase domain-containing protein [Rhizobium laguerreae]MBY3430484.1 adenylate/guanylate cyclase domain-containing prot